jgi:hypothetical protein
MTTDELKELIALLLANKKRERCGIKSIDLEQLLQLDPIGYDEVMQYAQAIIDALTPMMRETVKHTRIFALCGAKIFGANGYVFHGEQVAEAKQTLASIPDCWKGGV